VNVEAIINRLYVIKRFFSVFYTEMGMKEDKKPM
jgi:hypothetical protein